MHRKIILCLYFVLSTICNTFQILPTFIRLVNKVGFIGLVEKEWIETLNCLNNDDILFESFVDVGRQLAIELKEQEVSTCLEKKNFFFLNI